MLVKSPTPQPAMTYARAGTCAVRLANNLRCPHCQRKLHATDVDLDFGDVRLICQGCYRDVLTIGSAS
jgi:hypothetical protein